MSQSTVANHVNPLDDTLDNPPSYEDLTAEIINLFASMHAANYRFLGLIRTFDEHRMAERNGFLSTAQWLSWYLGIGPNAAREKVRVTRALAELPILDKAFEQATLSYSKVRALTRVATPDNEQALLDVAECANAHQTERVCAGLRPGTCRT